MAFIAATAMLVQFEEDIPVWAFALQKPAADGLVGVRWTPCGPWPVAESSQCFDTFSHELLFSPLNY